MSDRRETIDVLRDDLERHPAFLAWKRICPASATPASIELLKREESKSAVYRLKGVTGADGRVVVKRKECGALFQEARFYTEVFPALSLPVAACYGYLEEYDGESWLFLEDAGEIRYSPENRVHRSLAIRWMASLHSTPAEVASNLPDFGPAYFRSVLREARQGVRTGLSHPSIWESSIAAFKSLMDQLDVIEKGWEHVEQVCSRVPQTIVHGDFVPKNVRVRGAGDAVQLLVIDWETAGAAPPAADIAMLPGGKAGLRTYFEILKNVWRTPSWEEVERLHRIGEIFRLLHCLQWATPSFEHAWIERAQRKMPIYQRALLDLVRDGRWLHG